MLELANIGLFTAFLAGLISFVSPCVLPLVPGYLSYVAGRSVSELQVSGGRARLAVLWQAFCFVLGFSTVFLILGASATVLGRLLLSYKHEANLLGGAIVILFGLFMTGLIRLRWLNMDLRWLHKLGEGSGPLASYVLGLAFAFGWTPCIGPILGAILTVSASSASTLSGVTLLGVYSLGLGVPFLLTALFMSRFLTYRRGLQRWGRPLHIIAGVIMILMGLAMMTGQLSALSYWLLEVFPSLGRIG